MEVIRETSDFRIDIASNSSKLRQLQPLSSSGYSYQINLDGVLSVQTVSAGKSNGYAQFFRNGIIETAAVIVQYGDVKRIPSFSYEAEICSSLHSYFSLLNELSITTPAYMFLSLLGVNGWTLAVRDPYRLESRCAERDNILLPEMVANSWTDSPEIIMRPAFDMVWNAFGLPRSKNYNEAGEWIGQR